MNNHSNAPKSGVTLQNIIAAVVIALLVGSSSPWWWNKVFPDKSQQEQSGKHPSVSRSFMGELEGGTNGQGNDLSNVGLQVNSAQECSDYCAAEGNCKAMTFVKNPSANGGICWLKGSVPSPSSNSAMVSAVKRYSKR